MSGNLLLLKILCYVIFFARFSNSFMVDRILHGESSSEADLIDLYIPTVYAESEKCRNHSLYYLEQLKNHTLWASEMFDSSTKFPSGVLYGSAYDFGNFDECLEVKVPYENDQFNGQYCLAKFTVGSSIASDYNGTHNYHFEDYTSYYNISIWKKVKDFLNSESKNPRNEMYFSYCLPSSCSNEDLQSALRNLLKKVNDDHVYKVNVDVSKYTCQVAEKVAWDTSDKAYVAVVLLFIGVVIVASVYDNYSKRDDYQHIRLSDTRHDLVLCFSFPRNYKRLMSTKSNPDGLNCLAGLKVYSMFLSISNHRNMFDYGVALDNPKFVEKFYTNPALTYVLNGPILVDTFFTISGFLSAYLILCQLYRSKKGMNLLGFIYFHRYIRLTATYAVVIFFYCTIFSKMGSGPLWKERLSVEREKCRQIWWANLLYINNYVGTKYYCMFQSWYMGADMNSFIVIPLICWLIWKKTKVGLTVLVVAILAAAITVFIVVFVNDERPIVLIYLRILLSPTTDSTFLKVYIPGHMRVSAYLVGALAGYMKYKMKEDNIKIPRAWIRVGWVICVILMFVALQVSFVFYTSKPPAWFSALYAMLHHLVWSICISWMIIAISFGHGSWIDGILSFKPLIVFSRLSYTVYLCHGITQLYSSGAIRNPNYASLFNQVHRTTADIVLGYLLAFFLTIIFESPIVGIEKTLLWKEKRKPNAVKEETLPEVQLSATQTPA